MTGRTRSLSGNPGEDGFGYSQGVLDGSLIAIAGQVGRENASGEMVGATTLSRRLGKALANVREVATDLGGPGAAIVSLQLHVPAPNDRGLGVIAERINRVAGADRPAVTIVPVTNLFSPDYLVEVSAMATTESRRTYEDRGPVGRVLGSSRAVRVGDDVVIAGHLSLGADGALLGTTPAEQLAGVIDGLGLTLAEAGGSLADIVATHIWVLGGVTTGEMEAFHAVHSRAFSSIKPAATLVFVPELPMGAMVQVSALARLRSYV